MNDKIVLTNIYKSAHLAVAGYPGEPFKENGFVLFAHEKNSESEAILNSFDSPQTVNLSDYITELRKITDIIKKMKDEGGKRNGYRS